MRAALPPPPAADDDDDDDDEEEEEEEAAALPPPAVAAAAVAACAGCVNICCMAMVNSHPLKYDSSGSVRPYTRTHTFTLTLSRVASIARACVRTRMSFHVWKISQK